MHFVTQYYAVNRHIQTHYTHANGCYTCKIHICSVNYTRNLIGSFGVILIYFCLQYWPIDASIALLKLLLILKVMMRYHILYFKQTTHKRIAVCR